MKLFDDNDGREDDFCKILTKRDFKRVKKRIAKKIAREREEEEN